MKLPKYHLIAWGCNDEPPISQFTNAATSGLVYFNEIEDDDGYYVVLAADHKLTVEEIDAIRATDEEFKQ